MCFFYRINTILSYRVLKYKVDVYSVQNCEKAG